MAQIGSRRGAAPSTILMILAFIAMAGFLYWLAISAEDSGVQVVENPDDTTEVDSGAREVAVSTFQGDPASYVGERLRVTNVRVSSLLGQTGRLFWLAPDDNPYLIHRDSTVAPDRQVDPGMRGTVTGVVHEMSDSTLDAWEAEGSFTSESDRFVAEFAETYIEADRFQLRPGSESQEEGGNDG